MIHELLFEHGINLKTRTIFLFGDIENGNAHNVLKGFSLMASSPAEITLVIKSDGGDVYDTFAIYDMMKSLPNSIRTIAFGGVCSAAPLLVAAGTVGRRFCFPSCQFMVHDMWIDSLQKPDLTAARKEIKHYKVIDSQFSDLMEKHSKVKSREWKKMCSQSGDVYFDAKKALKYGIIDSIVTTLDWSKPDGEKAT